VQGYEYEVSEYQLFGRCQPQSEQSCTYRRITSHSLENRVRIILDIVTVSYIVYLDPVLVCVLQEQRKTIAVVQVQESSKKKKEKESEQIRTADERSRAILWLRRWHSVIKALADLSTTETKTSRELEAQDSR
jgi:hypothetical protein